MNNRYCPYCGFQNSPENLFCLNCGQKIKEAPGISAKTTGTQPSPVKRGLYSYSLLIFGFAGFFICLFFILKETNPEFLESLPSFGDQSSTIFTSSEKEKYNDLLSIHTPRRVSEISPAPMSLETLSQRSRNKDGIYVVTSGQVYRRAKIETPNNQVFWLIGLRNDVSKIDVVYQGNAGHIIPSNYVEVTGIYDQNIKGVIAHKIIITSEPTLLHRILTGSIFYVAIFTSIWIILVLANYFKVIWRIDNPAIVMGLFILSTLTGCSIKYTVEITPDDVGIVSVQFAGDNEQAEFFKKVPITNELFQSWRQQMKTAGYRTDLLASDQTTTFHMQRRIEDFFSRSKESMLLENNKSWIQYESYDNGRFWVKRFEAEIDTTTLYQINPELGSQVVDSIKNELDKIDFDFNIVLPCKVVYHNADEQVNNRLIWNVPMNSSRHIVAEAQCSEGEKGADQADVLGFYKTLVVVYAIFITFAVISILKQRIKFSGNR